MPRCTIEGMERRIALTVDEARKLGIIVCTCRHPKNNHFGEVGACAHCTDCRKLDETVLRYGKWIDDPDAA